MTIPAIAAGFGVGVERHPELESSIRYHYGDRMTEEHLLMAQVPEGATLIDVEGLHYPQVQYRNVFILPGVPQLFQYKFNAIKARFRSAPIHLRELYLKADEGVIAATLREIEERFPGVLVGSYPSFFRQEYSVKVTVEGRAAEAVESAFADLQLRLGDLPCTIVRVA